MTVLDFIHYSRHTHKARRIQTLDRYDRQCMKDMTDTLQNLQAKHDQTHPGKGGGVALAANQLYFPYQPISHLNSAPAPGFYPKDYIPPYIYLVHIRPERAQAWHCEPCEPTFFINAILEPLDRVDEPFVHLGESSASLDGFHGLNIPRYNRIHVYAQNELGQWFQHEFSGWHARVHQHEVDFCRNIEYLLRLPLSVAEIKKIKHWIAHPILEKNWILKHKLQFVSNNIEHIEYLKSWIFKHEHMLSRVIIFSAMQAIGPALMKYYLEKGHQVIVIYPNELLPDLLQEYLRLYPDQLTIKTLNLKKEEDIVAFIENMSLQKDDLIFYEGKTNIVSKNFMPFYLEFHMLLYDYYDQLSKSENVLWVNINHAYDDLPHMDLHHETHDYRFFVDASIKNTDKELKEVCQNKNMNKRSCVISIHTDLSFKNNDYSEEILDKVVQEIVVNCIETVRQTKSGIVYHRSGLCEEALLAIETIKEKIALQQTERPIESDNTTQTLSPFKRTGIGRSEQKQAAYEDINEKGKEQRRHSYPMIWQRARLATCSNDETESNVFTTDLG